jgi:hypothetical protein
VAPPEAEAFRRAWFTKESVMIRMLVGCLFAILLFTGNARAQLPPVKGVTGEVHGIVKSMDAEKSTVTVKVGDKEQTLTIAKDARFQPCLNPAKSAGDLKPGTFLVLFTAERDGKVVVIDLAEDKKAKNKK